MTNTILSIDPGTIQSAYVLWDVPTDSIINKDIVPNDQMLEIIQNNPQAYVIIEMVASYGMPVGRAQPLYSNVLTPSGFKPIGEMVIGDTIIGIDSITYSINGVFNQGIKDIYELTFTDNTTTRCSGDHLWALTTPQRRYRGNRPIVLTTNELLVDTLFGGKVGYKYALPKISPITFAKKDYLPINPYILGCLIGDGTLVHSSILITNVDEFIYHKLSRLVPNTIIINRKGITGLFCNRIKNRNNVILNGIRELKLNCKGLYKFIPEIYKFSSISSRIDLLHGLMDTDGYINSNGHCEYTSISKRLIEDICALIQSLGGVARYRTKQGPIKNGRRGHTQYTISFTLENNILPCSLPRKLIRYKKKVRRMLRSLKSITKVGEEECKCISTTAPDNLYLTDNFIPTHNTTFETVFWIGRFAQVSTKYRLVYRKDIKMYWCHSMKAKDSNIRQALIDKYGEPGTKKAQGKLYGVSKDIWSALAIASYSSDMVKSEEYSKAQVT